MYLFTGINFFIKDILRFKELNKILRKIKREEKEILIFSNYIIIISFI